MEEAIHFQRREDHMIRSTLLSLSIYFLSLFQLSRAVRMRLDQIQRNYLWVGGNLDQKPHLVNWRTVCRDKRNG